MMTAGPMPMRPSGGRILVLDLGRTLALIGMAIFHFGFDLEAFGHIAPGTMTSGFWYYFARSVAGSFLFLVGISLWLAHGHGIRWRPFLVRLGQIVAGAALVTLGTWKLFGPAFVFFGILHSIALSSVIGLAFLRLPPLLTLAAAVLAFYLPDLVAADHFASLWLVWTGLAPYTVYSVDFIPTFPWLAPVLAGLALAKLADRAGLWQRLRGWPAAPGRWTRWLAWPGRHGLFVYLVHQPILISLVWAATQLTRG